MAYRHIEVRPLSGALGAEVGGVDLAAELEDDAFEEVRRAFLEHLVLFFRDQKLTFDDFKAFGRRFGALEAHSLLKGPPGHPEILEVVTEPEDRHAFAEGWHADVTYQERPILGAVLYARELPPRGGDTLFSNQYLAYEALSEGMREMLDGLTAVHDSLLVYGDRQSQFNIKDDTLKVDKAAAGAVTAEHPVVRTHPETGRKSLFVNAHYTRRFTDMTEEESRPLLAFLFQHAVRPEFTNRFQWQVDSIAFWDNRCSLHCPIADYYGHRRYLHRIAIEGDRPA